MIFMLREGPLQRCPVCGQVYKLVRLRDETQTESEYYISGFLSYEFAEFGEADHWHHMSYIRLMRQSYEHQNFPIEQNRVYSLLNADDHDRVLTDPAYRMKKLTDAEKTFSVFNESVGEVRARAENSFAKSQIVMEKDAYDMLIEAEINMKRYDRAFKKSWKFSVRQFLDIENHERREARMLEKSKERTVDSYTTYFGGMSEDELMYNDYFETEVEETGENEAISRKIDEEIVRSDPDYLASKYQWNLGFLQSGVEDSKSIVENILFGFRNRQQIDNVDDYNRRQNRMVSRQVDRVLNGDFGKKEAQIANVIANGTPEEKQIAEEDYFSLIYEDALNQYSDYFETDGAESLEILKNADLQDTSDIMQSFKDYTKINTDSRGYYSIPKRKWNKGMGLTGNLVADFADLTEFVLPKLEELSNISQAKSLTQREIPNNQFLSEEKVEEIVEEKIIEEDLIEEVEENDQNNEEK